jgi:hypothetical protein
MESPNYFSVQGGKDTMKKTSNLFWGIALILLSVVLLADRLGYIDFSKISDNGWVFIFGGAAILFFLVYVLNGFKNWGWLFPVLISAALSVTIWLATNNFDGAFLGAPILAAVGIPFYVGFALNRRSWGLLIPAWVLSILTIMTGMADRVDGTLIGGLFLLSGALPFLIVFLLNRTRHWALIPTWVLFVLGVVTLISNHVNGNLVGSLFLYSVALPFLVVYLVDHSRRWALVPAAVIAIIGTFPLISMLITGDAAGAVGMFLFALPFFIVYFRWKEAWWAFIPAGIFTSIGLVVVVSMFVPENQESWSGILTGLVLLGFALTFGLLWLRRSQQPTHWALYPAIALLAASLLAFILGKHFQDYWSVVLLVVGILMVVASLLPKKSKEPAPPPNPS